MHNGFLFLLADIRAIWSFGSAQGDPDLGMVLGQSYRPRFLTGFVALALLLAGMAPALAARKHHARPARATVRMPASPTDPAKDAALVVDGATGKVLYARNETAERHPASL